jgi:hypothetical protein
MMIMIGLVSGIAHAGSAKKVRRDELVVRVASYGGITWGHVDVYYRTSSGLKYFHKCARRRCYFYPVHGSKLLLRETPRNAKAWHFRGWIIKNGGHTTHGHSSTLKLRVLGHLHDNVQWFRARVKANYVTS